MPENYKIRPEIKDFILEQKKLEPVLSCRNMAALIEEKFQVKVSKSSINFVFKQAGLSMPVGRRLKERRKLILPLLPAFEEKPALEEKKEALKEQPIEAPPEPVPVEKPVILPPVAEAPKEEPKELETSGAVLLKAADFLAGGTQHIAELLRSRLTNTGEDILAKTEGLLYQPLFAADKLSGLWGLVEKKFSTEILSSYLNDLQAVKAIDAEMSKIVASSIQEVRGIKINLSDGSSFYLDGQLHTVWSTPHIPYDFATTLYNIKSYINKYLYKDSPFLLFSAPGYETPSKEFFDFLSCLNAQEKRINRLIFLGNKFEEIESLSLEQTKKHAFVFGLWPWQFVEYRKVHKFAEFKPLIFAPLNKEFYWAEVEISLLQHTANKEVKLRGVALKLSLNEKTRLLVLTNLPEEALAGPDLANIYLGHWPNMQEAFEDFSRKVELFTYTANSQRFFSTENLNSAISGPSGVPGFLENYLQALDGYVKWHFLPAGWEEKGFPTVKSQFYDLRASIKRENEFTRLIFLPPEGFGLRKELGYALARLNEREVFFRSYGRLWFSC